MNNSLSTVIYPPNSIPVEREPKKKVFLAGSIEMGKAEDWQAEVVKMLPVGYTFLNPRRPDFNPDWVQSDEDPRFIEQVA